MTHFTSAHNDISSVYTSSLNNREAILPRFEFQIFNEVEECIELNSIIHREDLRELFNLQKERTKISRLANDLKEEIKNIAEHNLKNGIFSSIDQQRNELQEMKEEIKKYAIKILKYYEKAEDSINKMRFLKSLTDNTFSNSLDGWIAEEIDRICKKDEMKNQLKK